MLPFCSETIFLEFCDPKHTKTPVYVYYPTGWVWVRLHMMDMCTGELKDTSHDPQCIPETKESTKSYICYGIFRTHIAIIKFNLSINHGKRLTILRYNNSN